MVFTGENGYYLLSKSEAEASGISKWFQFKVNSFAVTENVCSCLAQIFRRGFVLTQLGKFQMCWGEHRAIQARPHDEIIEGTSGHIIYLFNQSTHMRTSP